MRLGYSDALTKMGIQSIKDGLMAIKINVKLYEDKILRELEQQLHQLERDVKDGNSKILRY